MVRKDVNMTEDEKKLLQAKHRQEAVEARNRIPGSTDNGLG